MADERVRIEVAFEAGQAFSALVSTEAAEALEEALGQDGGVVKVEAEDGQYLVAMRRVVYVKRFAREPRVGFGAATAP